MLFIKNEDLKIGMRIAKPIYNKKGVLLYERDSKLTQQGIDSVKNFGLIGLYILEPAEPVPPMTPEDIDFERFQTMTVFQIQDELEGIVAYGKYTKLMNISTEIVRRFGRLNKKINFVQNLRSNEDYIFKHSLNCAILAAMMTHVLNVSLQEQEETVLAALLHDIGKLTASKELKEKGLRLNEYDIVEMEKCERLSPGIIEGIFQSRPGIKRSTVQSYRALLDYRLNQPQSQAKLITGAKVLMVADIFDTMTAMNDYREPSSEVTALRALQNNPMVFDVKVVEALVKSINFLTNGCCVELNNGEKGLVLAQNDDVLAPMVLCFSDNSIVDLSRQPAGVGLEVRDVMKTMDNRIVVDKDALKNAGML